MSFKYPAIRPDSTYRISGQILNFSKNVLHFFTYFKISPLKHTVESWQPAALQAARQYTRPTKDNKKHYSH